MRFAITTAVLYLATTISAVPVAESRFSRQPAVTDRGRDRHSCGKLCDETRIFQKRKRAISAWLSDTEIAELEALPKEDQIELAKLLFENIAEDQDASPSSIVKRFFDDGFSEGSPPRTIAIPDRVAAAKIVYHDALTNEEDVFANNDINVLPRREPHTQHGLLTRILDILVDGSELSKFEEVEEVEAITQGSVQAGVKKSFCT